MGCNVCKTSMTVQETQSIGLQFVSKHFDALTARPGAAGLDRFYDDRSRLVVLERRPRSTAVAQGVDQIARLMAEMNYHKCTLNVDSVETEHVDRRWYYVLAKGELVRRGERLPRLFLQSMIFKYASSSRKKRFRIVETMLVFYDDDTVVDDLYKTVSEANILSTEAQHQPSPDRVEGPKEESVDGDGAKTPGGPATLLRGFTTRHPCYGSELTLDESFENDENQRKYIDAASPAGEPRTRVEKPTEGQRSIAPKRVPQESVENGIECAKQLLVVGNITTTTSTESNAVQQPSTERKQLLVLKQEETFKNDESVEDTKRHVNTAITPDNESRKMRKLLTEKQSEVLKHILEGWPTVKPRRVDEQTTGGGGGSVEESVDLKTGENPTEEEQRAVGEPAARHESVEDRTVDAGPSCSENMPKACGQWRTRSEPAVATMRRALEDQDETNAGSTEGSRSPGPANLLYVGALPRKVKLDDLYACFGRFGKVISVDIFSPAKKQYAQERQNCAIVRYENPETVDEVASYGTASLDNGNVVILKKSKKN